MLRIRLDLENLSLVASEATSQAAEKQHEFRNEVLNSLAAQQVGVQTSFHEAYEQVDRRIAKVEEMLQNQVDRIQPNPVNQAGPVYRVRPPNRRRPSPPQLPTRPEGVRVRLNQYALTCHTGCKCVCHSSSKVATPQFLDRVLGQLFVGYAGLPLLSAKCDIQDCAKRESARVSVEYWFPLGFCWSQIMRLQLGYQPNIGPQMSLGTLRQVPDSAPCVTFALNGNIDGLKDLFTRGLASPRDVSTTRGYSILRVRCFIG